MANPPLNRWESLDYLRGLMALAILVFHYEKWTTGVWNPATPQGKLGVYAVSIFFMISGMALAYTYENAFRSRAGVWKEFVLKRVLRIYPLLWLATIATLALDRFHRPIEMVLLNLSGMFGFINPAADIATGAWSIGCELVYYCFFPFLLLAGIRDRKILLMLTITLFTASIMRAFFYPFSGERLAQDVWWSYYVQAWQHMWYFLAGMTLVIYRETLKKLSRPYWMALAYAGATVFVMIPVSENPQDLIGGALKMALSVAAFAFATGWTFGISQCSGSLHRVLAWLGAISYSLYLLHPLAYRAIKSMLAHSGYDMYPPATPLIAALTALLLSHFSYFYFEKPLLSIARNRSGKRGL